MARPVFDYLWRHESYQLPLLFDKISDLMFSRQTRTWGENNSYKCKTVALYPLILPLKGLYTLSPLRAAAASNIIKLQPKFYKPKMSLWFFTVFTCFNLASSSITFQCHRFKLTPANSLLMQRESSKKKHTKVGNSKEGKAQQSKR